MPDVVVVGAGLSGLTAARELHRHGLDVVVLESADRIGGRALTETSALGSRLDLGGQWIGHEHHRLTALAAELGATPFPMHTGRMPTLVGGSRQALLGAALALAAVGVLSHLRTPQRWSTATVESWLRRVPGRGVRRLLEVLAAISWTADLDRLSVRAALAMIRSQGGLTTMLSTRGGAQDSLLVEGVGALVDGLAAELGERVRTGQRVTAVVRDEHGVLVRTAAGDVRAAKVVIAVPPPVAAGITHEPPLPPERVALGEHTYMGSVLKAIAVYERPFWRDRGSAELLVLGDPGCAVFDTTPPGGPGHLCFLVGGPEARGLDAADRRAALLQPLVPRLGPAVLTPASWHEKAWHLDEHAGGGYMALPLPGVTAGPPPMPADPVGNVHWAGSETAAEHPGYLDGAVEAGERAAREVRAALLRAPGLPGPTR